MLKINHYCKEKNNTSKISSKQCYEKSTVSKMNEPLVSYKKICFLSLDLGLNIILSLICMYLDELNRLIKFYTDIASSSWTRLNITKLY